MIGLGFCGVIGIEFNIFFILLLLRFVNCGLVGGEINVVLVVICLEDFFLFILFNFFCLIFRFCRDVLFLLRNLNFFDIESLIWLGFNVYRGGVLGMVVVF